ncbi:MAG: Crp/Fnr family transcriptional regulator [Candidatus Ornithospirochaeta sp.]
MIREARDKKGDVIYRQGDEPGEIFFVKYGTVCLYVDYGTDESKLIGFVTEGRVFGELGVIEEKPRTMTVVAKEETIVTVVDKESFPSYVEANPNKLLVVMESLSSRIRAQSHKLMRACRVVADAVEEKDEKGEISKALMDEMKLLASENRKARE